MNIVLIILPTHLHGMFSVVHVVRLIVVAVVAAVRVMRVRRVVAVRVGRVGRGVASGAGAVALPRCARAVLPVVAAVHGSRVPPAPCSPHTPSPHHRTLAHRPTTLNSCYKYTYIYVHYIFNNFEKILTSSKF